MRSPALPVGCPHRPAPNSLLVLHIRIVEPDTYHHRCFPSELEHAGLKVLGGFFGDKPSDDVASRELYRLCEQVTKLLGETSLLTLILRMIGFPMISDVRAGESSLFVLIKFSTPFGTPACTFP